MADETERGYQIAKKALENENYLVEPLKLFMQKEVPADCAVLVVGGPEKAMEPGELEVIDKYVAGGGHVLFLVDPRAAPGMDRFLAKWGVKVGDNVVVDQVFRLFYGPALGADPVVEDFGEHEITKDFNGQVILHMACSVGLMESLPAGITGVSLAKTSDQSWAETDLDTFFKKSEVSKTADDLSGPVSVAVALTIGKPGTAEGDEAKTEEGKSEGGKKSARMVVVGDADFIDNEYLTKMYNGDLFLNMVNWLSGEEALISIRPKTTRGSMALMTPEQTQSIFFNSVLIFPEILLLLGLAIWWRRR